MKQGYLSLETHPDKPGMVRLVASEQDPRSHPAQGNGKIRFVQRFQDIDTARMHAHSAMRTKLADLNNHLYRKPLAQAMGDLEAIELPHEHVWRDPELNAEELATMEEEIEFQHRKQHARDRFVQIVKWVAIGLLLFNFLAPGINQLIHG